MSESIRKKIGIVATMAIALTLAVVTSSPGIPASAQLVCTPEQNPAGHETGKLICTCLDPTDPLCSAENQNPAGNAPPGQNK